jgi:crossover junction endodeoxyribonuclease RusA
VVKGRAIITSANKNLKSFRQQVSIAAITVMNEGKHELIPKKIPVDLTVTFFFKRPASKSKNAFMVVRPDLDKILRAIGDSLTGICFDDDSQITDVCASKRYGDPERTEIEVWEVGE